jgi:hypothetical protein
MSVTHIAGPVCVLDVAGVKRGIQRCVVCGEKLSDTRGQMGLVSADGLPPQAVFWKERHYVEIDGNRQSSGADFADPGDPPEDLCIELVE